jgi:TusE/DsrC/DsvC family sulfur relay protein
VLDINNSINDPSVLLPDPAGHMYGLEPWSHQIAQTQASTEGLGELSDMHWLVIHELRGLYRKNGRAESAHQLICALEKNFIEEGGRRHLYRLFPQGPVTQGSRLAGVPAPPYSGDAAMGWFG